MHSDLEASPGIAVSVLDTSGYSSAADAPTAENSDVTSQRNLTSQGEFWTQRAVDNIWLGIFVLTNAGLFIWRFLAFPLDPVIGYWPAIAKASAALALLNILLVLLAVCYRLVGRINLCLRRHCRAFRLLPPLYKPIVFHKIAGTAAVGAATLHSLSWIVILGRVRACQDDKDGGKSTHYQRLQFVGHSASATNLLSETPIWTGAVMVLCMLVALPFCIQPLRELSFKSFALTHLAFAPMVLLTLIHGLECWVSDSQALYWLAPALVLYTVERRYRIPLLWFPVGAPCRLRSDAVLENATIRDGNLELTICGSEKFRRRLEPGMYTFLAVPQVSRWEWHPFSVVSSTKDTHIKLHVRVVGDWTRSLVQLLNQSDEQSSSLPLVMCLDGPIPAPTQLYREYVSLILISTGVGVVPHLSVLRHILRENRGKTNPVCVRLLWSTRQSSQISWLLATLEEFADVVDVVGGRISIAVHLTGLRLKNSQGEFNQARQRFPCLRVEYDRITWREAIDDAFGSMESSVDEIRVGVFVCAGATLTKEIRQQATASAASRSSCLAADVFTEGF